MVLSANKPNGTFQGPHNTKIKKTWAQVISGQSKRFSSNLVEPPSNSPTQLPTDNNGNVITSAELSPPFDPFSNAALRPFLKGSFAHSILIDISQVKEKYSLFISEFQTYCDNGKHLFFISDKTRTDYGRLYAEVQVSPLFFKQFSNDPTFNLPSFTASFLAYPSLASTDSIRKISFTNLPPEYGRPDGGLAQLKSDMTINLQKYGDLLDSGLAVGTSGVYAGYGYAVLAISESQTTALTHSVDWLYFPLNYDHLSGDILSDTPDSVHVLATWASMPSFCRYCHSDQHALLDCPVRQKATVCRLCNKTGHIAKFCPRKNTSGPSPALSKKPRKMPKPPQTLSPDAVSSTTPISSNPVQHTPVTSDFATSYTESSSSQSQVIPTDLIPSTTGRVTRTTSQYATDTSKTTTLPVAQPSVTNQVVDLVSLIKVCKHCKLPGHERTNHGSCLANPKNKKKLLAVEPAPVTEDEFMMEIESSSPEVISNPLLATSTESSVPSEDNTTQRISI
ncbi:hypothetical protein BD770DRAFT_237434 [Pilaira anomala]|nr:hypothetical protein BD770DRAFT_237434 [Pilaira anomala]